MSSGTAWSVTKEFLKTLEWSKNNANISCIGPTMKPTNTINNSIIITIIIFKINPQSLSAIPTF